MTSTSLEKLRQQYQDIEDKRKQAVRLMMNTARTIKESAYCLHHEARLAHEIQDISQEILQTLEQGIEKEEDPVASFYEELRKRITFHQEIAEKEEEKEEAPSEEQPTQNADVSMNDFVTDIKGTIHLSFFYDNDRYQEWRRQRKDKGFEKKTQKRRKIVIPESDEALVKFSGEECFGLYLDLFNLHRQYIDVIHNQNQQNRNRNKIDMKSASSLMSFHIEEDNENLTYLEFLEKINNAKKIDFIPKTPLGAKFAQDFVDYLLSFIDRTNPFFDVESFLKSVDDMFMAQYRGILLQEHSRQQNSFYCPYCDKYFETEEMLTKHNTQNSHKKNVTKSEKTGGLENLIEKRGKKKIKFEGQLYLLFQLIEKVRPRLTATIENTKRRETASAAVLEAEADLDAPIVFDESDDEDEQHFYNPKGLPLGWDGKPIPYWLYKLHGLSVEYKCEICGNKSYWGSLSFERHFFDTKHKNGLKALGIPPTRQFLYVTGVSEALALYDKLKKSIEQEVWQKGDEEVETEDGQVMSYKIYRDLTNQGIIKQKALKPK